MALDDSGWDTPRAREEAAWARRERLATRIRDGSWKLLGAVAAVQVFQSLVSAFS
jgi:hypothetical protein